MRNGKEIIIVFVGFVILCATVVGILSVSQDAAGDTVYVAGISTETTATASPSPSPSPTPLPPASSATVKASLQQRAHAKIACGEWNRARRAFALRLVPFSKNSSASPARSKSEAVWVAAGKGWKRDAARYHKMFARLRYKMVHPGGSSNGVRWIPLARWVGWPESTLSTLADIIMRESSGRERAYNPSGASGLLQLMAGFYAGDYYNFPNFDPFNPELNLYYGHKAWHVSGWAPWAL